MARSTDQPDPRIAFRTSVRTHSGAVVERVELRETIEGLNGLYAAVANAGAAPLGLVLVGVSIRPARPPLDTRTHMLGTESVVNLLIPSVRPWACCFRSRPLCRASDCWSSTAGMAATARIAYVQIRQPSHERPFGDVSILHPTGGGDAIGAIGLIVDWQNATYAPALYVFLMLIIGTQNAWDLLLGRPEGRQRNDQQ